VHLVFADNREAKALVKAKRARVETRHHAVNGQPGPCGFLLQALNQRRSNSFALHRGMDRNIDQRELEFILRHPQTASVDMEKENGAGRSQAPLRKCTTVVPERYQ
jgi:hypothetical protein